MPARTNGKRRRRSRRIRPWAKEEERLPPRKTKAEIRLLVTSIPRIRDKEKGGRMFIYLFIGDDRTGSFPLPLL